MNLKPFSSLIDHPDLAPHESALSVVKAMTGDEVRYALWACLTLLFGSPDSNAPEILADSYARTADLAKGCSVLAHFGMGSTHARDAERLARHAESLAIDVATKPRCG